MKNASCIFRSCVDPIKIFTLLAVFPLLLAAPVHGQEITREAVKDLLQLGQTELKAMKWDQAKEAFQKAAALDPKSEEAHFELARCFYHGKDFEQARNSCKTVIELDAANWKARRLLGHCYLQLGAYADAIDSYKKYLSVSPNDSATQTWLGIALCKTKHYDEAVTAFQTALQIKPADYEVEFRLGIAMYYAQQYKEAVTAFQTALQVKVPKQLITGPDLTEENAHLWLGNCYFNLKNYPEAVDCFKKCISIAPKNIKAGYWLGRSLYAAQRNSEAVAAFQAVLQIKPNDPDCQHWLGRALYTIKKYQESATALQAAARAIPDDFDGQYWLGRALYASNREREAVTAFQAALRIKPDDFSSRYFLGIAFYASKKYQPAADALQAALKIKPENFNSHYWLGQTWSGLQRDEDAIGEFQAATRINPDDFDSHYYLGSILFRLQKFPEALEEFEKAHLLKPKHGLVKFNLFCARLVTAKYRKAAELYPLAFALGAGGLGLSYLSGLLLLLWKSLKKGTATAPGLFFIMAWFLIFFEGQAAGVLLAGFFLPAYKMTVMLNAALFGCAVPVAFAAFAGFERQPWGEPFALSRHFPSWKTICFCLLAAICMVLFTGAFEQIIQWVTHKPMPMQLSLPMIKEALADAPWLTAIAAVILAPMAEEILFRGLLYGALVGRVKTKWTIIITAAAFAAVHLQVFYFLPLFVMGLILGWARHKSGSLTASFLIHSFNNGFAFLALKFFH